VDVALTDTARRLLDTTTFATVATLNRDGGPQTSVVWVKRDGDDVLFSTTKQRRKGCNLARDPRISLTLIDPGDPYTHVEIRGRAELTDDPDNALGNELSHKYLGVDAPHDPEWVQRIQVRVIAERVVGQG
jgi:PPOX class probable F420-dependent enzyme